jgi:glycerophosphoryl diester phosphodiesterase
MAAFELAMAQGADAIELDIWPSRDGRAMVIHDRTLERTTDAKGAVDEWLTADLRDLDAGGGERIPLLEEVLDLTAGRVWLDLELKTAAAVPALCEALAQLDGPPEGLMVSSFDARALETCRQRLPAVRRGLIQGTPTLNPVVRVREAAPHRQLQRVKAAALVSHHRLCWKGLAKSLRARGIDLLTWTKMTEEAHSPTKIWRRMLTLPVDGIVTTRPGDLHRFLAARDSSISDEPERNDSACDTPGPG